MYKFILIILVVLISSCSAKKTNSIVTDYLEITSKAKLKDIQITSYSKNTFLVKYDWERGWWGSIAVLKLKNDKVIFDYPFNKLPTAQSVLSIEKIRFNEISYIKVIDQTHMGNGFFYLYAINKNKIKLILSTRVITNLGNLFFNPKIANIKIVDLNNDGLKDILIEAKLMKFKTINANKLSIYKKIFYFKSPDIFVEDNINLKSEELLSVDNSD